MSVVKELGRLAYRFKPARTFAQVLAGSMGVAAFTEVAWSTALDVAFGAALACFLLIWAEGGEFMGVDKRVTRSR